VRVWGEIMIADWREGEVARWRDDIVVTVETWSRHTLNASVAHVQSKLLDMGLGRCVVVPQNEWLAGGLDGLGQHRWVWRSTERDVGARLVDGLLPRSCACVVDEWCG
jgi:hypothetical protein